MKIYKQNEIDDLAEILKNDGVNLNDLKKRHIENTKKRNLINKELTKIYEKYAPIKAEYMKETRELYLDYEKLDLQKIDKKIFDDKQRKNFLAEWLITLQI